MRTIQGMPRVPNKWPYSVKGRIWIDTPMAVGLLHHAPHFSCEACPEVVLSMLWL